MEINAPDALLAAHAEPGAQPAAAQQVAEEHEAGMDGAEDVVAAPAAVPLSQEEWIEQRNAAFAAEAAKHAAEKVRVRQQEREDQADLEQADWYEKKGGAQRTGPGVGHGHFDSDLSDADFSETRWARNYMDKDAL